MEGFGGAFDGSMAANVGGDGLGPESDVSRLDTARLLLFVFVVAVPAVCMTILAAVMVTPTAVWGRWQKRLPPVMYALEVALRWRTVPLTLCAGAAGALAVALLLEYRQSWTRFAQCNIEVQGDCAAIVAMAPLALTVALATAFTSACCCIAGWYRRGDPPVGHRPRTSTGRSSKGTTATAKAAAARVKAMLDAADTEEEAKASGAARGAGKKNNRGAAYRRPGRGGAAGNNNS